MSLDDLRKKIDRIDEKLVKLLNDRAQLTLSIGQNKLAAKKGIYAPDREKAVLDRIKSLNLGPMTAEAFCAIYREIMSASLSLEKDLQIAYLGKEGSFTSLAAMNKFGSQVKYLPCQSILEVFQKVEQDDCDYGVVPVENSVEGAVTHTFDLLVDSDLKICAQMLMPIAHVLMSKTGKLEDIKEIYSNPQVFGQCRHWLQSHVPQAALVPMASTTEAAELVRTAKTRAAIASEHAAKMMKLNIVRRNIQDIQHNTTRFLVLAKDDVRPTGKDRTSIVFSIKDRVGALHAMLEPFQKYKINLTKIESRPSKKRAWDYFFFVDFEGHRQDQSVGKALDQLEEMCKYLKILGSYPAVES